jgi:hypothetical protein
MLCCNVPMDSVRGGKFLDQPSDYQLLRIILLPGERKRMQLSSRIVVDLKLSWSGSCEFRVDTGSDWM